jgi:DNA-binding transcriptional LysR family regulator
MQSQNNISTLDLNLLPILFAVLRERHITRAANSLGVNQPKVSKALDKLRWHYQDELLVRGDAGYSLTQLGHKLLRSLQDAIPAIESVVLNTSFNPASSCRTFKIAMSSFEAQFLTPKLTALLAGTQLKVLCTPHTKESLEDTIEAKIDLTFNAYTPPPKLSAITIGELSLTCLVRRDHPFRKNSFTLKEFTAARHIALSMPGHDKAIIDATLERIGLKRDYNISTVFFAAAAAAAAQSDCVLTVVTPFTSLLMQHNLLRRIQPPKEIGTIVWNLVWSPVYDRDAGHVWLREHLLRLAREMLDENTG